MVDDAVGWWPHARHDRRRTFSVVEDRPMRIYRVSWSDPHEGWCYAWCTSMHQAHTERAAIRREAKSREKNELHPEFGPFDPEIDITPIEFPTTKVAVVAWLNARFTRNNG